MPYEPHFRANEPVTKYISDAYKLTIAIQVEHRGVVVWDMGDDPPTYVAHAEYCIANDDVMVSKPPNIDYSAQDQKDGKPIPKLPDEWYKKRPNIYAAVHVPYILCKHQYQKKYISSLLWYHVCVIADANYDTQLLLWRNATATPTRVRSYEPPLGAVVVDCPDASDGMMKYWNLIGFNFAATQMTLAEILAQHTADKWVAPFDDATVAKMAAFWDNRMTQKSPGGLSFQVLAPGQIYGALERVEVLALAGIKKGGWFHLPANAVGARGKVAVKPTKHCIIS